MKNLFLVFVMMLISFYGYSESLPKDRLALRQLQKLNALDVSSYNLTVDEQTEWDKELRELKIERLRFLKIHALDDARKEIVREVYVEKETVKINQYTVETHIGHLADMIIPNVYIDFEKKIVGLYETRYERLILFSLRDSCIITQIEDCRDLIIKPTLADFATKLAEYKTDLISKL